MIWVGAKLRVSSAPSPTATTHTSLLRKLTPLLGRTGSLLLDPPATVRGPKANRPAFGNFLSVPSFRSFTFPATTGTEAPPIDLVAFRTTFVPIPSVASRLIYVFDASRRKTLVCLSLASAEPARAATRGPLGPTSLRPHSHRPPASAAFAGFATARPRKRRKVCRS